MELLLAGFVSGVDPSNEIVWDRDTNTYYTYKVQQRLVQANSNYIISSDSKMIVISRKTKIQLLRSDFEKSTD